MLIPGRKVNMVFSICQIRQFSDTTELLQEEIIVFVNTIVEIVHKVAIHWEGTPTNNNGDKYLITWRLPTSDDAKKSIAGSVLTEKVDKTDPENAEAGGDGE